MSNTNGSSSTIEASYLQNDITETAGGESPMPIAIIGLSCKFAGDATSSHKLWQLCAQGKSAWSTIPADRFNQEAFYHPVGEKQTTSNIAGGYFFRDDVSLFDASFFNMSSDVADTMDPQCRLQLESVYEALESAGIPIKKLAGTSTAVFAGLFFRDYQDSFMRDPEAYPRQVVTGNGATMMSNRISHFFDLHGPSMTVDTACSTALVALHMACQSLQSGESKMAIVGGVNVMLNPDYFILLSSLGFLSPDGKCYAFDDRASGYARGEGVGALIIKPLADALRDGDPVRAVIRGTAVNQNGKTQTITSPNVDAQEAVIRNCYRNARLDPSRTAYVEAHGTGTQAGDPVEAEGIARVLMPGRPSDEVLHIGSVKTNLGHTEAASGLASIIKMVHAIEQGVIPPSINHENPNQKVKLEERRLKVPQHLIPWPAGHDRRVSINNFGYGGTNAHVILEAAKPLEHTLQNGTLVNGESKSRRNRRWTFILSGKDESATERMLIGLREYLQDALHHGRDADGHFLDDLAYTLCQRRSSFSWSIATSACTLQDLVDQCQSPTLSPARSPGLPRLGFVFTGQGAQWYAMGRELISYYPLFKQSLLEADDILLDFGCQWSLMDELTKDAKMSRINEVKISPPLCIALQISLVRLLRSWAIHPVAVTGHSSGEFAAAFAANVIDYRSALAIAYFRGTLTTEQVQKTTGRGAMMAVGLGREEAEGYISTVNSGKVVVACVNSPSSVTISGDYAAIEELRETLQSQNIFARRLNINAAFHSHHMQPIAKDYHAFLYKTLKQVGNFDGLVYSSPVTGARVCTAAEITAPGHWVKNMLQPVEFSDCFWNMCFDKKGTATVDTVIEIGPHGALAGPMRQILAQAKDSNISITTCLTRNEDAVQTMHAMVAHLILKGHKPDFGAINFPRKTNHLRVLYDLPSYPWTHKVKHWSESRLNRQHRLRREPAHDLLGSPALGCNPAIPTWRQILRAADLPWVFDHRVQGDIIYPAAGFCCIAIEAVSQLKRRRGEAVSRYKLRQVEVISALVVPEGSDGIEVQLSLLPFDGEHEAEQAFRVFSVDVNDRWTEHCKGHISVDLRQEAVPTTSASMEPSPEAIKYSRKIDPADLFNGLRLGGIAHGKIFQNIDSIDLSKNQSRSTFHIANTASIMPGQYQSKHVIHPTTLDSVIVAAYSTFPTSRTERDGAKVPRFISELYVSTDIMTDAGSSLVADSHLHRYNPQSFEASVSVKSPKKDSNGPLLQLKGLRCQSLGSRGDRNRKPKNWCSVIEWQPDITFMSPSDLRKMLQRSLSESEALALFEIRQACFQVIRSTIQTLQLQSIENLGSHYKRLFGWMSSRLEEPDVQRNPDLKMSEHEQDLLRRVRDGSPHGKLIYDLASVLPKVMQGELNPLSLLLEHQFLDNVVRWDRCYQQIAQLVELYSHRYPRARYLEVGAGTGACAQRVFETLGKSGENQPPQLASYDFTDVSPGFFEGARERLTTQGDLIRYRKLDADADPIAQGFEAGFYDVIISSHVLQSVKNVTKSLGYLDKMLKPGGKLILAETTRDKPENALVFGMLPGWWVGEEEERKQSPTLSAASWKQYLNQAGFGGLEVEVPDCDNEEHLSASVMMVSKNVQGRQPVYAEAVLIVDQSHAKQSWVDELRLGISTLSSSKPEVSDLGTVNAKNKVCIFLDEIFAPLLEDIDQETFEAIKSTFTDARAILWVSRGGSISCTKPQVALHNGLLRVLRCEDSTKRIVSLDLDPDRNPCTTASIDAIMSILRVTFDKTREKNSIDTEYAERACTIYISRAHHSVEDNQIMDTDPWETEDPSSAPQEMSNVTACPKPQTALTSTSRNFHHPSGAHFSADASYLIIGAFGGIGQSVSRWMASAGAGTLILLSRNAERSQQGAVEFLKDLESMRCRIFIVSCDVSDLDSLKAAIAKAAAQGLPPIRGVIQSAMVLKDFLFPSMSLPSFRAATIPKVRGTYNLHLALPCLDFFIILSSIVGAAGNAGQANYAAGGSFQDALARHRSALGLPCVSIDLGAVKSVGYLADESSKHLAERFTRLGFEMLDESTVLRVVEAAIMRPRRGTEECCVVVGAPVEWGMQREEGAWSHDLRWSGLGQVDVASAAETKSSANDYGSLSAQLSEAKTPEDTLRVISGALIKRLSDMFMTPESDMDTSAPLASFGIDSLVAVELRGWIVSNVDVDMSIFEVLQSASVAALSEKIASKRV